MMSATACLRLALQTASGDGLLLDSVRKAIDGSADIPSFTPQILAVPESRTPWPDSHSMCQEKASAAKFCSHHGINSGGS